MRPRTSCMARAAGGDEMPQQAAWSPRRRAERIAEALAQLEAERTAAEQETEAKAAEFRVRQRAGRRTGPPPAGAAAALAQENLARGIAARGAQGRKSVGEGRRVGGGGR